MNPLRQDAGTCLDSSTVTFNGESSLQCRSAIQFQEAWPGRKPSVKGSCTVWWAGDSNKPRAGSFHYGIEAKFDLRAVH
ncbi:MAG: hypothetical protein VXZ38_11670 [Planctomycetota bacterium]|nr:hypothetical protein [Planctomycetota bacterium]